MVNLKCTRDSRMLKAGVHDQTNRTKKKGNEWGGNGGGNGVRKNTGNVGNAGVKRGSEGVRCALDEHE